MFKIKHKKSINLNNKIVDKIDYSNMPDYFIYEFEIQQLSDDYDIKLLYTNMMLIFEKLKKEN